MNLVALETDVIDQKMRFNSPFLLNVDHDSDGTVLLLLLFLVIDSLWYL